jgi:hypothetical protein
LEAGLPHNAVSMAQRQGKGKKLEEVIEELTKVAV